MRKLLITLFFVILIIALLFLSQPQLRHIVITGVIQFPEFATMQAMKGGLITRDFNRVIPWLERQMDLTTFYGKTKNKMTPGMLENISKAYEAAVLKEERERFIPILERAYILNPNNIDLTDIMWKIPSKDSSVSKDSEGDKHDKNIKVIKLE